MENFINLVADQPVAVVLGLWILLKAAKELLEYFDWWQGRAKSHFEKTKAKEEEKAKIEQQVCDIACTSEKHTETLAQIGNALDGINKRLDKAEEERKQDTVANSRATLLSLYDKLKDKETLTVSEYDAFAAVADRYLAAGGNKTFKNKIIPEIQNIPIED